MRKKGQITIFLIAGFALILIASLLIYMGSVKIRKEAYFADASPVSKYTSECLKKHLEEGIAYSSSQAGYIFESQSGTVQDLPDNEQGETFVIHTGRKVPFLISYTKTKDNYPWSTYPHNPESYNYPLGVTFLQSTRQLEGQIDSYVNKKLLSKDCLNFERDFKDYQVIAGKPKTKVTFTEKQAVAELEIPLSVYEKSTSSSYSLKKFRATKITAIKRLYDVARNLIEADNYDFKFDMGEAIVPEGVHLNVIKNSYEKNGIIVLSEAASESQLVFARQNRRPALEYAQELDLSLLTNEIGPKFSCSYNKDLLKVSCTEFEFFREKQCTRDEHGQESCRCEESGIPAALTLRKEFFSEKAQDPDEQELTFKYSSNGESLPLTVNARQGRILVPATQTATDGKLEDSQTINFELTWKLVKNTC